MANRILLGKDGSDYVLKVSQPGDDVTSPSEPLIFDSTSVRSGMIYAGGNSSSTTGINWSSTKGTLGYIPLSISMDDAVGTREEWDGSQLNEDYQIEDLNSWHWADMEEAVIAYDIGYVNGCKNAIKIINEQMAQVEKTI